MRETNGDGWWIYRGTGVPHDVDDIQKLPPPPNWRQFNAKTSDRFRREAMLARKAPDAEDSKRHIGWRTKRSVSQRDFQESEIKEIEMVNAALYLRRPLLVTGKPGSGKSSLAHMVARELQLGQVLHWPITTRSTVADGLYRYDAIGRLQEVSYRRHIPKERAAIEATTHIGKYLRLGPLGTALLPWEYPRVLLIDEIDKSDIDLPNDLLNIFEEGSFDIPELKRMVTEEEDLQIDVMPSDGEKDNDKVPIMNGRVQCHAFPFVVMTSNGERDFPPAFLRRCLRLEMQLPNPQQLAEFIEAHFPEESAQVQTQQLINSFITRREGGPVTTDQLLNAIYMTSHQVPILEKENLYEFLLKYLTEAI